MDLPADEIYPRGRLFPFWGYSGTFEREAESGFTLGGQHYGGHEAQMRALESSRAAGLRYVFSVGATGTFVAETLEARPAEWAKTVAEQVRAVADDPSVAVWAVHPEELRMWRANEVEYLRVVTETIRKNDQLGRPIYMYEPNNRLADGMVQSAVYLDFVSRGAYADAVGFQHERVWVRWVMQQQIEASRRLFEQDGRIRPPWFVGHMAIDPEREEDDSLIAEWVRHDVYGALVEGAKGVAIWSLWAGRPSVRRTYEAWYEGYSSVARELTGPLGLGQVFLFGETRGDLTLQQKTGPETLVLWTGPRNEHEMESTHQSELDRHRQHLPAVVSRELAYMGDRYFFVVNSVPEPVELVVGGWPPQGVRLENAFNGEPIPPAETIDLALSPWGVAALRLSPDEMPELP